MALGYRIISGITWGLIRLTCKLDIQDFQKVPFKGPYIIAFNHINFLDAPLLRLGLRPRNVKALVKAELTRNFLMRYLTKIWGGIPIERGGNPRDSFKKAEIFLKDGGLLCIAPEGTRSKNGKLQQGQGGIVLLAHSLRVPILPVVHFGTENYWKDRLRFKRTKITLRVGEPFELDYQEPLKKSRRNQDVEKIMKSLAAILPRDYWGVYG